MKEKDVMDALSYSARKLRECQDKLEPDELIPWFETRRVEQCLAEFERDGMQMTIGEGVVYETLKAAMGRFEMLAEESARVASTPEQLKVAATFKEHVAVLNHSLFQRPAEPIRITSAADLLKQVRDMPKPANDHDRGRS